MLNERLDKCVLVKGWKSSAAWSFPKGKINKDEPDDECAIREVKEETGFDATSLLKKQDYIELTLREQHVRLYIVQGVPVDTIFIPQTRKEISKIDWFSLNSLPTYSKKQQQQQLQQTKVNGISSKRFYMIAPFLNLLRKWLLNKHPELKHAYKKADTSFSSSYHDDSYSYSISATLDASALEQQQLALAAATEALKKVIFKGRESAPTRNAFQQNKHPLWSLNPDEEPVRTNIEASRSLLTLLRNSQHGSQVQTQPDAGLQTVTASAMQSVSSLHVPMAPSVADLFARAKISKQQHNKVEEKDAVVQAPQSLSISTTKLPQFGKLDGKRITLSDLFKASSGANTVPQQQFVRSETDESFKKQLKMQVGIPIQQHSLIPLYTTVGSNGHQTNGIESNNHYIPSEHAEDSNLTPPPNNSVDFAQKKKQKPDSEKEKAVMKYLAQFSSSL